MRPRRLPVLAAAAVLGAVASAAGVASALTLAAMPLEDLTRHATLVVRARCVGRDVVRGAEGRVESRARFEVLDAAKGAAPGVVTVRQLGGRLDGTEVVVPGAPLSEPGDEAVLFLEPHEGDTMGVVGLALGYLPVTVVAGAGARVHVSRALGAEYVAGGVRPVDELLDRVRAIDAGEAR